MRFLRRIYFAMRGIPTAVHPDGKLFARFADKWMPV